MRSTAKFKVAALYTTSRAMRKLSVGSALIVFPMLPRFGEPSAILVADITSNCPQPARTLATTPLRGQSTVTASVHSPTQLSSARLERVSARAARPSLSVRLRALWESRGRMSPAVDRAPTAAQPATRSSDLPRS